MSLHEIERFAADLRSDAALRAEAEKVQTEEADGTLLARAIVLPLTKRRPIPGREPGPSARNWVMPSWTAGSADRAGTGRYFWSAVPASSTSITADTGRL